MLARCAALLGLLACERAHDDRPPPPRPRDAQLRDAVDDTHFTVVYAARTDNALDGTNGTYFTIVEDEVFFAVADAADPRDSKLAIDDMSALVAKDCHDDDERRELTCAFERTNARLVRDHRRTSLTAIVVNGTHALVASAGQTPVVLCPRGKLDVIDDTSPPLGAAGTSTPRLQTVDLRRGDTMALVSRRLLEVAGAARICAAAPATESHKQVLEVALRGLMDDAQQWRRRDDALSAILIHFIHPGD
jgi:hypothetical protein